MNELMQRKEERERNFFSYFFSRSVCSPSLIDLSTHAHCHTTKRQSDSATPYSCRRRCCLASRSQSDSQ